MMASQTNATVGTPTYVSESALEFLLSGILHWVELDCQREHEKHMQLTRKNEKETKEDRLDTPMSSQNDNIQQSKTDAGDCDQISKVKDHIEDVTSTVVAPIISAEDEDDEDKKLEESIMVSEHAAAKMEQLGYDVGFRLVERLAQSKSLAPPGKTKPSPILMQLEAVKFLCKEFWIAIYKKQIDKLQTNHRGVFVLRDKEFKWLKRLPEEEESARVLAMKILAFPCGLIRGALANLGMITVVSCDFLTDGKNMCDCSFNIKIRN